MFKVNKRSTKIRLKNVQRIKSKERHYWSRSGVFNVNFEHNSQHLVLVLLFPCSSANISGKCRLGVYMQYLPLLHQKSLRNMVCSLCSLSYCNGLSWSLMIVTYLQNTNFLTKDKILRPILLGSSMTPCTFYILHKVVKIEKIKTFSWIVKYHSTETLSKAN